MLDNHISKQEAMRRIRQAWQPRRRTETVGIDQAAGRVIAADATAGYDIPVVRAAGMDGICVNFDLLENGIPDTTAWTRGREYERADTGDDFDDRFDTVLPIEWIEPVAPDAKAGDRVLLSGGIRITPKAGRGGPGGPGRPAGSGKPGQPAAQDKPGQPAAQDKPGQPKLERGMNVRPAGSLIKRGALLLRAGMRITALDIPALVTGGFNEVEVIAKPVISFIPTGSELIPAGQPLHRGQNYDANSHLARVMLEEMGACAKVFPIVKDKKAELSQALEEALIVSDIVIINGGSSKGDEDFNTELLEGRGRLLFHWIKAAPGRPMAAAVTEDGKLILNIAGPTLAAYYGIAWCVRQLLEDWYGAPVLWGRETLVLAGADLPSPPLSLLLKLKVTEAEDGTLIALPAGGPGRPAGPGGPGPQKEPIPQCDVNAVYFTDPEGPAVRAGESLRVLMVR
ncbi:MAG: molybdopterin molybdenumtransferase MoeA [Firmicutes bacterium]|nr:molybdopterin molybdenumtransferase MoeA [Bacillota bacterium]